MIHLNHTHLTFSLVLSISASETLSFQKGISKLLAFYLSFTIGSLKAPVFIFLANRLWMVYSSDLFS
jgi:hypothetical protein